MISNVIKKKNRKISLNQVSFDQLIIKSVLKVTSSSAHLDQKPAASVIGRKRPERLTKTMEDYGRIEDGRQSKICYHHEFYLKTRCSLRSSLQLLKQSNRRKITYNGIVIITDSLSTIMAAENHTPTKTPRHELSERR
jgi:hypothetical protein